MNAYATGRIVLARTGVGGGRGAFAQECAHRIGGRSRYTYGKEATKVMNYVCVEVEIPFLHISTAFLTVRLTYLTDYYLH